MGDVERDADGPDGSARGVSEGPPVFGRAVRGYDPIEVDTFLASLLERLAMARDAVDRHRERRRAVEGELGEIQVRLAEADAKSLMSHTSGAGQPGRSTPDFADLGDEVARILASAAASATGIRRQALEDSMVIRAEAREKADQVESAAYDKEEKARASFHDAEQAMADAVGAAAAEAARVRREVDAYAEESRQEAWRLFEAAQFEANRLLETAKTESERLRHQAQDDAEAIIRDVNLEADTRLAHAAAKAKGLIDEAKAQRKNLNGSLQKLYSEMEDQIAALESRHRVLCSDLSRLQALIAPETHPPPHDGPPLR